MYDAILKNDERIALTLRALYAENGYRPFKMSKFEEYDLYMKNKDFLMSDNIITFNDTNGTLLALKPDVTLSIVKNSKDLPGYVQKVYYQENVYRVSGSSGSYKEIMQTGVECIGDIGTDEVIQVVRLAMESIRLIGGENRTVLSHVGFLKAFFAEQGINPLRDKALCDAFFEKNGDGVGKLCEPALSLALRTLMQPYPSAHSAEKALLPFCGEKSRAALAEFVSLWDALEENAAVSVDFTVAGNLQYYSGIVFKCYLDGIAVPVISGGQYDGLMRQLGRSAHAIGFAVYLDTLERLDAACGSDDFVGVALPKGRLGEKVYDLFEKAGFDCPEIRTPNRKLIFENREKKLRFFWVKPSDVAIYVQHGAADIGVAGSDILAEYNPDVYELCDLKLGRCRMAVAAKNDFVDDESKTLRVATKFQNTARRFYAEKCRDIDIIHLNGSIELAPILGLSDVIVDIVETGKTLLENGLSPVETIAPISARLISNKSSYQFKKEAIEAIRAAIAEQVNEND